jgi:hypothetical protein
MFFPSSGLKSKPNKKSPWSEQHTELCWFIAWRTPPEIKCLTYLTAPLAACFVLVSCLAYALILKTDVTSSCETSVDFQQATQHYVPEGRTLHNHCFLAKHQLTVNRLHSIMSQKVEPFIITAVRTSDHMYCCAVRVCWNFQLKMNRSND